MAQGPQGMAQPCGGKVYGPQGMAQPPSLTVPGFPEHQPQPKPKQPHRDLGAGSFLDFLVKGSGFAGGVFAATGTALEELLLGEHATLPLFKAQIHWGSLAMRERAPVTKKRGQKRV